MPQPLGFAPKVNHYHHDKGLLFQFILSEFLLASREARALTLVVEQFKMSAEQKDHHLKREYWLNNLKGALTKLTGPDLDFMRMHVWNVEEGPLAKFKDYCALLARQNDHDVKEYEALSRCSQKTWLLCLQSYEEVREIEKKLEGNTVITALEEAEILPHYEFLYQFIDKILSSFERMVRVIIRLIHAFGRNENVLLFLLRYRDSVEDIFGKDFVLQALARLHPNGLSGTIQSLKEKFSDRGFEQLHLLIDARVVEG